MLKNDQSITGSDMVELPLGSDPESFAVVAEQLADVARIDPVVIERVRPFAVPVGLVGRVVEPALHAGLVPAGQRQVEMLVDASNGPDRVARHVGIANVTD